MSTTYTLGVRIDGNAAGMAKAALEARRHVDLLGKSAIADFNKMAKARELLGVRSEREVQREIQRTQAAHSRLVKSGQMSWGDQQRAAQAMRRTVEGLNNEMGKLSARQRAISSFQGAAMAGAAVGAGVAVVAPKVKNAMAYDLRLAHLSNTENSGLDKAGRQAGMRSINQAVIDAVQAGGGTREGALDTYERLAGSGIFKPNEIRQIMKDAVLAGTANNADSESFAQMAITANKSMGIKPEQMSRLFGIGTYAGQQGGFEIKDMAKHLPSQMALAKAAGLQGEAGFAKLAALNQAAVNTAGTNDEAGINVINLLSKLNSTDTQGHFKRLGIDLPKRLAEGRMAGMDAIDVMGGLLDEQLGKDKNYQNVKRQLAMAKDGTERKAALEGVGDIAQGTVIGKVYQDRQALMALLAFMNDRARVSQIAANSVPNANAHYRNMEVISDTASYKTSQLGNENAIALQASMEKLSPAIGTLAEGVTGLMRQYPGYATAVVGATTALTALTAAAGAAGLASLVFSGPGGASGAGGVGQRVLSTLGLLAPRAGVVGAGLFAGTELYRLLDAFKQLNEAKSREGVVLSPEAQARLKAGSAEEELGKALKRAEFKGEVKVRVFSAPGVGVDADVMFSNPRIPLRADLGQTNLSAGY